MSRTATPPEPLTSPDLSSDSGIESLGPAATTVPKGRHTALNDAVFTAALYVRMMHGKRPA